MEMITWEDLKNKSLSILDSDQNLIFLKHAGITDERDIDIYEGDFIAMFQDSAYSFGANKNWNHGRLIRVGLLEEHWAFEWTLLFSNSCLRIPLASGVSFEVVGNCFQNPEIFWDCQIFSDGFFKTFPELKKEMERKRNLKQDL